jgi:hypothetical protein
VVLLGPVVADFQPQEQHLPHPRYPGITRPNCVRVLIFAIAGEILLDAAP